MTRTVTSLATLVAAIIALVLGAPAGIAGTKTATIEFGAAPSTSRADNGDTIELSGEGSFTLQPKSVSGDAPRVAAAFGEIPRTWVHRDADGNVLAEGTWEPTDVLSYRSYGPATEEQDAFFGGLPPGTEGGKLTIKVALYAAGAHVADGIVGIDCLLGVPPDNAEEAVTLLVQQTGQNFNQPVHADSVFIRHVD